MTHDHEACNIAGDRARDLVGELVHGSLDGAVPAVLAVNRTLAKLEAWGGVGVGDVLHELLGIVHYSLLLATGTRDIVEGRRRRRELLDMILEYLKEAA